MIWLTCRSRRTDELGRLGYELNQGDGGIHLLRGERFARYRRQAAGDLRRSLRILQRVGALVPAPRPARSTALCAIGITTGCRSAVAGGIERMETPDGPGSILVVRGVGRSARRRFDSFGSRSCTAHATSRPMADDCLGASADSSTAARCRLWPGGSQQTPSFRTSGACPIPRRRNANAFYSFFSRD